MFSLTRVQGTVKKWNSKKGFGFIDVKDGGCDVFAHYSEIQYLTHYKSLQVGEIVEFQIVNQDNGKRKAINVTKPGTYKDHKYNKTYYEKQKITKVGRDATVTYGDDGENDMIWNIYVCKKLQHTYKTIVRKLKKELIELGEINNDWRENEPIQNIIDPDLFIYKFYEKNWLKDEYKKQFDKEKEEYGDSMKWTTLLKLDEKGYFIRRKYQWLSTQFIENKGKISICSPIHNIPSRLKYKNIYIGIEHIFEKMLPLFNKFEAFRNRSDKEFQVIVKSQRYCIDDMSGYSGHWHKEGLTENIIIVGLYYYEINEGLIGGDLKFRNLTQPTDGYAEDVDEPIVQQIFGIREGTAVVFDNVNLVHRLKMLKNKIGDKQKRYRSFLAFFIVDPEKPISSTKNIYLNKDEYIKCISKYTQIHSIDIVLLICEYGACGYTLEEAQNIRKINIDIRKNVRGKWGSYHYGNCGEKIWFNNGREFPHEALKAADQINWLNSTNSEFT